MYIRKIRLLWLLTVLLAVLLTGCISGTPAGEPDGQGTGTSASEADSTPEALARQLEALRASMKQTTDSLEARIRELEAEGSGNLPANADSADFTYDVLDGGIRLTGWSGSGKSLVIPQTIQGKPVTAIADGAFRGRDLESVTIPAGVVSVGWFAFSGCYRLSSVSLPASVTDIGYGAFENCAASLRILCPSGSYAERYASSYGIPTSVSK